MSLSLLISKDEVVPLYLNDVPVKSVNLSVKSKKTRKSDDWFEIKEHKIEIEEDIDDFILLSRKPTLKAQTVNFAPHRILYLRGSAVKDFKNRASFNWEKRNYYPKIYRRPGGICKVCDHYRRPGAQCHQFTCGKLSVHSAAR